MRYRLGGMTWFYALCLMATLPAPLAAQADFGKRSQSLRAETTGPCTSAKTPEDRLTHGRYPRLRRDSLVDAIRTLMREPKFARACLWEVRPLLFDSTYTPHIVDWIVYIRRDSIGETVIEGITRRSEPVRDRVLRGEKFINVIVLFDGVEIETKVDTVVRLVTDDTLKVLLARDDSAVKMRLVVTEAGRALLVTDKAKDTLQPKGRVTGPRVEVRRDVLRLRRDPFLLQLLSGLGGKIFGGSPSLDQGKESADSTYQFELEKLGSGSDADLGPLLMARGKIALDDGMWGRLILAVPTDSTRIKSTRLLTNFVNTDRSRFGLSVGVGALPLGPRTVSRELVSVRSRPVDTLPGDTMPPIVPDTIKYRPDTTFRYSRTPRVIEGDTYLLVHYRIIPRNPWPLRRTLPLIPKRIFWYESAGVFVGTNLLKQSIGTRIPFGVSFDRLWYSDLGIAGGFVVAKDEEFKGKDQKPDTKRRLLPFVGITLAL